jgi:hypothetical protein
MGAMEERTQQAVPKWFDRKISPGDQVVSLMISLILTGLSAGSFSWAGIIAAFLWIAGGMSLILPSAHAIFDFAVGREPTRKVEPTQAFVGTLMLIGIAILWNSYPEDIAGMVNQSFSRASRVYGVVAALGLLVFLICSLLALTSRTPAAKLPVGTATPNLPAGDDTADELAEDLRSKSRIIQQLEQDSAEYQAEARNLQNELVDVRKQQSVTKRDYDILLSLITRTREANSAQSFQRAALDYWIDQFEMLSDPILSTDAEFDAWLKRVEELKQAARDTFIAVFNHPVFTNEFFNPNNTFTVGKKFPDTYDDRHNKKLNEIAALIRTLKDERGRIMAADGGDEDGKLDNLKTQLEKAQAKVASLTEERERLTSASNLPNAAEAAFIDCARDFIEQNDKSRQWKAVSIAIAVRERHMTGVVNSDEELVQWWELFKQKKAVLDKFVPMFRVTASVDEVAPPSRVLKQFRAYNVRHNELLNDIDFQLEQLRRTLSEGPVILFVSSQHDC